MAEAAMEPQEGSDSSCLLKVKSTSLAQGLGVGGKEKRGTKFGTKGCGSRDQESSATSSGVLVPYLLL